MSFTAPTLPQDVYGEANLRLGRIEAEENVTILFAVESGSRAWGFPSPDSDNDVRFFYIRPLQQYVGLDSPRDVIERPIDGVWDLNGWDLRKALQLLVKGNATVIEWLSSPLIYREHGPFPYRLRDLMKRHASPKASARHHYGLAKKCFDGEIGRYQADEQKVNLKKYLYAIRSATSIAWIEKYGEVPPMTLPHLMSMDILPQDAREAVIRLLHIKSTMGELGLGGRIDSLDSFITGKIAWVVENGLDVLPENEAFRHEANELLLSAFGLN